MIRRFIVWFVVIVTALAAGIALGGGPLSDIGRTPSQAAPAPRDRSDPLDADRAEFADGFVTAAAAQLYAGRLADQRVALLALPGADPDVVEQLGSEVVAAGGEVTATYGLRRALVDPDEKTLVDTLGEQVVDQLGGKVVSADATTYDRIGQLLGRAVAVVDDSSALPAAKVSSLRASLQGAGLLRLPEGEPARARLVLLVTGTEVEPVVLNGLAAGLASTSAGVVVAGPTSAPDLTGLRQDPPARPVATVDGTETPAGRVVAILALVHAVATPGGSFGASGADGPLPLG